ncbi:MAG: hypothetical protein N3E47_07985 [Candidatus Bathyarchaeota archaeon]|nr:hypothetical protein [Candidatus Bathyarchaeota archaeon]
MRGYSYEGQIWQRFLSDAKAGAAHGAYEWNTALRFPGAFDAAFAKWIFEKYDVFGIKPANEKL